MGWLLEQQFHRWIGQDTGLQAGDTANFLECVASRHRRPALRLKPTREEPLNSILELATGTGLQLPAYYRPTSERFPGVDGLILRPNTVVLIQVTVSSAHALKKEHLALLYNNLPVSIRDKPWTFVWVVPDREVGEALAKRRFNARGAWPMIVFYWCLFPFDISLSFLIRLAGEGADTCHQEGASKGLTLDIGSEIEEDEKNIQNWEEGEDEAIAGVSGA